MSKLEMTFTTEKFAVEKHYFMKLLLKAGKFIIFKSEKVNKIEKPSF